MIRPLRRRAGVLVRYALGHLARRDPGVWVFGNVKGFRDNPRYLAEHLVQAHPEIETWWVARTDSEAAAAREAGLRVAVRGRPEARVQRRAGVAFLSNGFADLDAADLGGAFVVDLRHGQGTKRILLAMPDARLAAPSARVRLTARLRRWYIRRRLRQVDIIVAPGELEAERYVTAFGVPRSRIPVLGTPRFDVLLGDEAFVRAGGNEVRSRLGLKPDDRVVLWLPTWRDGDESWLPPLDETTVDRALGESTALFLAKPHPYSDLATFRDRLPDHPRVRIATDDTVDVNCLLRHADALVTDYSSAVFDFALLERPIHFFAPDMEAYRGGEGLHASFVELLAEYAHRDWPGLLAAVSSSLRGPADVTVARRIRAESRNLDTPGSCERITRFVVDAVAARGR